SIKRGSAFFWSNRRRRWRSSSPSVSTSFPPAAFAPNCRRTRSNHIMTSPNITSPKPAAPAAKFASRFDRFQVVLLGLSALAVCFALVYGGYLLTVMQMAMIYAIFCVGLNFFMGYTGQASFGQNAFACIGGYGSAILCVQYGWEPALALIGAMVVAGFFALIIGYPTLRL